MTTFYWNKLGYLSFVAKTITSFEGLKGKRSTVTYFDQTSCTETTNSYIPVHEKIMRQIGPCAVLPSQVPNHN